MKTIRRIYCDRFRFPIQFHPIPFCLHLFFQRTPDIGQSDFTWLCSSISLRRTPLVRYVLFFDKGMERHGRTQKANTTRVSLSGNLFESESIICCYRRFKAFLLKIHLHSISTVSLFKKSQLLQTFYLLCKNILRTLYMCTCVGDKPNFFESLQAKLYTRRYSLNLSF